MISSMSNRYYTFFRQTKFVMDATEASASMSVTRATPEGAYIEITVSGGTTGSGSVTVSGTDTSGSSTSETLSFTSNGSVVTTTRWNTVTGFTTSGLADEATIANVAAKSVSSDGTPYLIRYSIAASRPMIESPQGPADYVADTAGTYSRDKVKFNIDYESSWSPRADDIAVDDATSEEWLISGVRDIRVGFGIRPTFYELTCSRSQT